MTVSGLRALVAWSLACAAVAAEGEWVRLADVPDAEGFAGSFAALVGRTVFVAGDQETPTATAALARAWRLDLDRIDAGWREIEPQPARGRILAAAGALDGAFVVCGGADLEEGPDGKAARTWLRDAWRREAGRGWTRLADLPRAVVAAPSPMPVDAAGRLLLLGGDDGSQAGVDPREHRGFPRGILAWDASAAAWLDAGCAAEGLVTTPAVVWRGAVVVPGGELRHGIRCTRVWRR